MEDKSLKDKAIKLKGKEYVLVVDRIKYFNEKYAKGSIRTALVATEKIGDKPMFIVSATVDTGTGQTYTGLSQAIHGDGGANKNAALENAETSAVGRALGMMGIGVIDSVASVDELKKADVKFDDIF